MRAVLHLTLAAGCVATFVSGCGGSSSKAAPVKASEARFDPAAFVAPGTSGNKWFPLKPGMQWVRVGGTDVGHRRVPHRVIRTITSVTKEVDGVRTVAVLDRDVDAGQLAQQSLDYFAQDKAGNVWTLGGYTEEYEGGRFVSVRDAWLGGVKGGKPGIQMLAIPRPAKRPYSIAQPPGADPDVAEVVKSGQSQCVTFKCFKDVLVIREGKASAIDNEFKYYAPGVGQILNTPRSASQHHDLETLVNLTQLSPKGLAEVSKEALKLEAHARAVKPDVFGKSSLAKATP
jgi:hypothetical protein